MYSPYLLIFLSLANNYSKVLANNFQKGCSLATEIVDNSSYSRWDSAATESQPLLTANGQQASTTITASSTSETTIKTILIPRSQDAAAQIPKITPSPGVAQNSIQRHSIKDFFSCTTFRNDKTAQCFYSFSTTFSTILKKPIKQKTVTTITTATTGKTTQKLSTSGPPKKRRNFINLGPLSPSPLSTTSETPPSLPTLTTTLIFLAPTPSSGVAAKSITFAVTENTMKSFYVTSCDESAPSAILTPPIKIEQRRTQILSVNQPASLLA
ncbi:hypothetical protein EYC80_010795 [Monilinia laxa]|uniref:Uncharacterized protein n=1 Tax=Monilinia laxa TaxID=61186 RepID=A0A5N6JP68_MONLA|nr:hypothetical protein EYC80_010795 [Monilinia laxa]